MTQSASPGWLLHPVGSLALCPLLAVAGTVLSAVCVAMLFLVSLTLVSATMAGLGRGIASELRILILMLVSGIWVTLLDLWLQAWAYPLSLALGIYVPLIAANTLLLSVGEQSLRCGSLKSAVLGGIVPGVFAASWLVPMGLVRELLGTGMLFSDAHLLPGLPGPVPVMTFTFPVLQSAPGALLVLALAAAGIGAHRVPAPR